MRGVVGLSQFGVEVADGGEGMVEEHAWPGVSHHETDLFTIGGGIAVDFAFATACLVVAFGAVFQPPVCIGEQCPAIIAQPLLLRSVMSSAIDGDHLSDRCFFSFYSVHVGVLLRISVQR